MWRAGADHCHMLCAECWRSIPAGWQTLGTKGVYLLSHWQLPVQGSRLASSACRVPSHAAPRRTHQQGPWLHTAAGLHCRHVQSPAVQQQSCCCCFMYVICYRISAESAALNVVTPQCAGRFLTELPCTAQSLQCCGQDIAAAGRLHCFDTNGRSLLCRFVCTWMPASSLLLSRCCLCCPRPKPTKPATLSGSSVHQPDPAGQHLLCEPTCLSLADPSACAPCFMQSAHPPSLCQPPWCLSPAHVHPASM